MHVCTNLVSNLAWILFSSSARDWHVHFSTASSQDKPGSVPKCCEAFTVSSVTHWRQILQHPGDRGEMGTVQPWFRAALHFSIASRSYQYCLDRTKMQSDPTSITPLCDWNYSKVLNQDSLCSVQIQIWLRLLYFTIARLKELILKNTPFKYRNVCVMVIMLQHLASARETLLLLPFLYLEEPPHHVCFQNWPEAFLSAPGVGQDRLQGLKFCAVNKSAWRTGQACDLRLLCICMRWSSVRTLF